MSIFSVGRLKTIGDKSESERTEEKNGRRISALKEKNIVVSKAERKL